MELKGGRIEGLAELKAELNRLDVATSGRLARNSVMAGARVVARHGKQRAPVETGQLRRSIKARRDPDRRNRVGEIVAFANAKYFYASFLEFGTRFIPARPFMRPAADESQGEVVQKMVDNLNRGIRRELQKRAVAEDTGEV